jgi:hypothetical protein
MLIEREELWQAPHGQAYMIVLDTVAKTDGYGKLVMSYGSAAQARAVYPKLSKQCYDAIIATNPTFRLMGHKEIYGFLPIIDPPCGIGIFQTRYHWAELPRLKTMQRSAAMLCEYAGLHPEVNFRLAFPSLVREKDRKVRYDLAGQIAHVLECLPNNVTVVQWKP